MTPYQTSSRVYFRPKYIRIAFSAKVLLSNNKNLQKTVINVCKLNVYLFFAIPGSKTVPGNLGTLILIRKLQNFACSSARRE